MLQKSESERNEPRESETYNGGGGGGGGSSSAFIPGAAWVGAGACIGAGGFLPGNWPGVIPEPGGPGATGGA